ncbi:MAG: hypothetical protein U0531_15505 [Dehalococcoidia bacterium]
MRGAAHGLDDLTSVTPDGQRDGGLPALALPTQSPARAGEASHGRSLASIGLAHDLDFCAEVDRYAVGALAPAPHGQRATRPTRRRIAVPDRRQGRVMPEDRRAAGLGAAVRAIVVSSHAWSCPAEYLSRN